MELFSCSIPYNSILAYMSVDHHKVYSDHFWQRKELKYGELNQCSKLTKLELRFKIQNMHTLPFLNAKTEISDGETFSGISSKNKVRYFGVSGIWLLDLAPIKKSIWQSRCFLTQGTVGNYLVSFMKTILYKYINVSKQWGKLVLVKLSVYYLSSLCEHLRTSSEE